MSQGSHRGRFLRFHPSLKIFSVWRGVWGTIWLKYWQKYEIGENWGESQIWVQGKLDLKNTNFTKKTQIFQNMRLFQNPLGWEHRNLMSRVSHWGRFWDCTLVRKIWVFEEGCGQRFGYNSCKREKLGKIVVKVRFGSKISLILKIKISPKN